MLNIRPGARRNATSPDFLSRPGVGLAHPGVRLTRTCGVELLARSDTLNSDTAPAALLRLTESGTFQLLGITLAGVDGLHNSGGHCDALKVSVSARCSFVEAALRASVMSWINSGL